MRSKSAAAQEDTAAQIAGISYDAKDNQGTHNAEGNQGNNLDDSQPELALTKFIHMKQVDYCHQQAKKHSPPKLADLGDEIVHDYPCGNHLRGDIGNPGHPVGPAYTAGPRRADVFTGISNKGTGYGLRHCQLRQAEHHAQHNSTAQQIR